MLSKPPPPPPPRRPGWVSISPSADKRRAGEASTGLQSAPGLEAQTCSCVGAASLGRKLISALEGMPEVGLALSACSDEGRAGEVMWEVAAVAGSKPRFLCWPGVTLCSLLCSVAPTSLAYTKLALQGKTGPLGKWACTLFCPLVAVSTYGSSVRALDATGPLSTPNHHPLHTHTQGQIPTGSSGCDTPTQEDVTAAYV